MWQLEESHFENHSYLVLMRTEDRGRELLSWRLDCSRARMGPGTIGNGKGRYELRNHTVHGAETVTSVLLATRSKSSSVFRHWTGLGCENTYNASRGKQGHQHQITMDRTTSIALILDQLSITTPQQTLRSVYNHQKRAMGICTTCSRSFSNPQHNAPEEGTTLTRRFPSGAKE